jgi:hypothetical protein
VLHVHVEHLNHVIACDGDLCICRRVRCKRGCYRLIKQDRCAHIPTLSKVANCDLDSLNSTPMSLQTFSHSVARVLSTRSQDSSPALALLLCMPRDEIAGRTRWY